MPKTKRLVTSIGATLNPLFRHMLNVTFRISPYDKNGNKLARHFYVNFIGGDKRLKLDNFKINVIVDPKSANTCMEAEYRLIKRQSMEEQISSDR